MTTTRTKPHQPHKPLPLIIRIPPRPRRPQIMRHPFNRPRQLPGEIMLRQRLLLHHHHLILLPIHLQNNRRLHTPTPRILHQEPPPHPPARHEPPRRLAQPRVRGKEGRHDPPPRHDGPVGEGEGAAVDGGDDGAAHLEDEEGRDGDGDEGPQDEEGFAGGGFGGEVAVADGEESAEGEVEGFEEGEGGREVVFGEEEEEGAEGPEEEEGQEGES